MWYAQGEIHSLGVEVMGKDHIEKKRSRLCRGQETIVEDIKGQV